MSFVSAQNRLQEKLTKAMQAPGYAEKASAAIQEENNAKAAKLAAEMQSIEEAIANFQKLDISSSS